MADVKNPGDYKKVWKMEAVPMCDLWLREMANRLHLERDFMMKIEEVCSTRSGYGLM